MNGKLIIKIAVGVSVAAFLFSLITLVRALSLGLSATFPMIQFLGSTVILAICFIMLYTTRGKDLTYDEPETPGDDPEKDFGGDMESAADRSDHYEKGAPSDPDTATAGERVDAAQEAVDRLYEKYHLSDFE